MPEKRLGYIEQMPEKFARWRLDDAARAEALAAVRRLNATLSGRRAVWAWPAVGAALVAGHPGIAIACDSCGLMLDLDLRIKPRDPDASVRVALGDIRCPRCNTRRLHSALGYLSPVQFEDQHARQTVKTAA